MQKSIISKSRNILGKWLKEWIICVVICIILKIVRWYCRAQRISFLKHCIIYICLDGILLCGGPEAGVLGLQSTGCSAKKKLAGHRPLPLSCCCPQFSLLLSDSCMFFAESLSSLLVFIILEYTMPQSCLSRAGIIKAKQGRVEGCRQCHWPSGANQEPTRCDQPRPGQGQVKARLCDHKPCCSVIWLCESSQPDFHLCYV